MSFSETLTTQEDQTADSISQHSIDDNKRKLILPTMWIGLQNGVLMVHSSLDDWKTPIRTVDLIDCILCIVYVIYIRLFLPYSYLKSHQILACSDQWWLGAVLQNYS